MEVGLRVVRGPDWKWQNQDNGEGHVGTVVEIGKAGSSTSPDKTVVVQWDWGSRTNYRVGYQGAYDLRVYDNAPIGIRHPNIICDSCKKQGIQGIRWKCTKCYDFDLCTYCYIGDKHDLNHAFLRFDSPSSTGVKMHKRSNSTKVQAFGIFRDAKVLRGPDWDWGNQDGGDGKPGRVLEIRGWDNESGYSVANVIWASGVTNVYRLGHKGKVDLKYVQKSSGGYYYRDHLPVVGESKGETVDSVSSVAAQCPYKVGDKVKVDLEMEIFKAMQEGHGGWNPRMGEYCGKVGTVHRITERGDVRVQYEGCDNRWTVHPGALKKVQQFSVGDWVIVSDRIQLVKDLQKGHGEWTDNMRFALGKTGQVQKVYADGDLRVSVGKQTWTFNPACCTGSQPDLNNTMSTSDREEPRATFPILLEQLLDLDTPSAEPDRLVREAAQGHTDIIKEIITKYPDRVDQKSSGKTALHVACHQGHMAIVALLLAAGANLEIQDEDGDTALHYSAFGNQADVTEFLLSKNAQVNAVNKGGCSALHVAVNKQQLRCVHVLLKHKCDPNKQDSYGDSALHDAIGKDSREIVEMLISYPRSDFTLRNKRGFNCLHHASLKGNAHATEKILLKTRQLVDVKKDDGFAALHLAALNGHRAVAEKLIALGKADLESKNNRRQTPLLLAVSQGHTGLVELLVSKGASVNVQDEDGDSCLHLALMRTSVASEMENTPVLSMIKSQISLDQSEGQLGVAVACYLVQQGADMTLKNRQGKSPRDVIIDFLKPTVWDLLRQFSPHGDQLYTQNNTSGSIETAPSQQSLECMVCNDEVANVVFEPCGHCIVCTECCVKMKKCLKCQKPISKKRGPDGALLPNACQGVREKEREEELRRRLQEMEDSLNCSICLENTRNVAFLCGHSACAKCAQPLKICHMCRKPIKTRINLFS